MKKHVLAVVQVAALCVAASLWAAPAAKSPARGGERSRQPITIKSSHLTADNRGKVAVFTGKVVAKQGDVTIFSDKLTVHYGETQGTVEKIEADGNVRILQQNRVGYGGHAVYENAAGRITLTGKPRVMQDNNTVTGKIISYLIDDERSTVTGDVNEPVITTIHPRTDNESPR